MSNDTTSITDRYQDVREFQPVFDSIGGEIVDNENALEREFVVQDLQKVLEKQYGCDTLVWATDALFHYFSHSVIY